MSYLKEILAALFGAASYYVLPHWWQCAFTLVAVLVFYFIGRYEQRLRDNGTG